jgi:hypothetical protein
MGQRLIYFFKGGSREKEFVKEVMIEIPEAKYGDITVLLERISLLLD